MEEPLLTLRSVEMTSKSWIQFSVGRVIAYLGVGVVENTVVSYQSDVAPGSLRGFFSGALQLTLVLGNIWGGGMSRAYATETSPKGWLVPVGVQFIPAVLIVVLVPWCVGKSPGR